jgi:hypothetical protein
MARVGSDLSLQMKVLQRSILGLGYKLSPLLLGFLVLLAVHGLSCGVEQAQAQSGFALRGRVMDQAEGAVKAARVTLSEGARELAATRTDGEGRFVFGGLAAGRYRILVTAPGFADYQDEATIGVAGLDQLRIALRPETLKSEIEVSTRRLDVEMSATPNPIVLSGEMLKRLPRGEQQLRLMLERMAGSFTGKLDVSVNGLSGASLPPLATIKEIRINNDPFSARYHEPGSARVEIDTKGGNASIQGSVYLNYRQSALDARNSFSLVKPPLEHTDVGGWWSSKLFGPRSFIFGFVERQRHDETIPVTAYLPDGQFKANLPTPSRNTLASLRLDFLPSDRHTISVLFDGNNGWQRGSELTSLDLPERTYDTRSSEQGLQAAWRAIVSPRLINEAQFRLTRERSKNTTDNAEAAAEVAGAFNGGGAQCCPERQSGERLSLADNVTFSSGRHLLKAGVSAAGAHVSELSERDFGGTFYYASLSFYRLKRPTLYTISFGEPRLGFSLWQFAAYLQDDIRLRPGFTLSPGLRYETQTHLGDRNNFAPRLGFAWAPFKNQKTVVRGGAGVFYQQLEDGQLEQALRFDGVAQRQVIINRPRLTDPLGGRPLTSFPASINKLAVDLRTPFQVHSAIGIERRLPHDLILTMTYNYMRGVHLFRTRDINAPLPGVFTRANPDLGRVAQLESSSTSTYHGLTLSFSQSLGERLSFFGNYTLSRAVDDGDGPDASPMDSYNLGIERGRSARDERHQFFAGVMLALPYGIEASPMIYFNTGHPYNITTGFDDNNDDVVNDRPLGVRRNSGHGPTFASVDLQLGKTFSLRRQGADQQLFGIEVAGQVTNLFNRVNLADFNGIQTSPFFGQTNAALNPRQIMLQITFNFH